MHAGVVPALMVAYSEADAVEGLDVDKYHFDKFTMRHNVDTVLRALWRDDRCLMDLMAMAAPDHPQCAALLSVCHVCWVEQVYSLGVWVFYVVPPAVIYFSFSVELCMNPSAVTLGHLCCL